MMLLFDYRGERDLMVDTCPITIGGVQLSLEKSEAASNRFTFDQPWLVAISATKFPPKHCTLDGIPAAFVRIKTVEEIDEACFMGNFSSIRVMVARATAMGIPETEFLGNPGHGASKRVLGSTFSIEVLRVWPRAEQMDDAGHLRPFFPRPPRDGGERGGPGWIASPNLFGPVLHGSAVVFSDYGWGELGPYYGYPVYYH
jgi:hypothetical protein